MTVNEGASLVKDVLLAGAAVATAVIAYLGLHKWRQELQGKTNFDAARNLIRAAYKLRDKIQDARSPLYLAHEFPESYNEITGSRPSDKEATGWSHAYSKRMQPVWPALEEFDGQTLEAEALWGEPIRAKTNALRACLGELNAAMQADIADKASGGEDFKANRDFGKAMRAVVASTRDDMTNDFNNKLATAMTGIEDEVRSHLRRGKAGGINMTTDKANDKAKESEDDDGSDPFEAYLEYNRVLRTWFVAFGVGGPALFLINSEIANRLAASGQLRLVVALFLIGAIFQVLGGLLNKIVNWYVYVGTVDKKMNGSRRQRFAEWVMSQFWIDIWIDLITTVSFGIAAWLLMTVFTTG